MMPKEHDVGKTQSYGYLEDLFASVVADVDIIARMFAFKANIAPSLCRKRESSTK